MFHKLYLITFMCILSCCRYLFVNYIVGTQPYESNESLISVPVLPESHKGTRGLVNLTPLIAFVCNKTTSATFN